MGSLVGTRLGHFRIERLLGTGGMGAVYAATDEKLERDVAVKVVLDELDSPATRKRFLREARLAAKLTHPNIATVFEVGEIEPNLYIVMELLEGQSLRRWMSGRRLPVDQALGIARDLARALGRAHGAGIAHRDIKPENVFITQPSPGSVHAKVLDFGLARQKVALPKMKGNQEHTATNTGTGEITGTPGYWSPEQAAGASVDVRTDIFSFGLVLYEMLTGRRAFAGEHAVALVVAVARNEPERIRTFVPNVAPEIEALVETCLKKKPEDRFADGTHLCSEVEKVLRTYQRASVQDLSLDEPTTADPGGPPVPIEEASTVSDVPFVPPTAERGSGPASGPAPEGGADPASAPPFVTMSAPTPSPTVTDMRDFVAAVRDSKRLVAAIAGGIAAAILIVIILLSITSKGDPPNASSASAPPAESASVPGIPAAGAKPVAAGTGTGTGAHSGVDDGPSFEARPGMGTPTPVVVPPGAATVQGSAKPRAKKPADCAQPFVIDSQGVKIPKLHCLN